MTLGAYPKAFAVESDPVISPAVSWILNGIVVTADSQSPQCASGITVPASGVSATAATLNGVVTPGGTSGDAAELVQAALTGLQPSTTY